MSTESGYMRMRRRAGDWARNHPRIQRHVFTLRHLAAQYRYMGGDFGMSHTELFLHEMPARKEFFRRAFHYLHFNGIEGDYAEFGCYGAMTFRMSWFACQAFRYDAHLWGFDSFRGLPQTDDPDDRHPRWTPGWLSTPVEEFHQICAAAGVPKERYSVVPGFYEDTLKADASGPRPETISLAYIDCDLHSSATDVLRFLEGRLTPGSVIGFDDWFCYSPDGPSGERLAALEHFADSRWALVPFVQYDWHGMSFLVEDRAKVPPSVGPW